MQSFSPHHSALSFSLIAYHMKNVLQEKKNQSELQAGVYAVPYFLKWCETFFIIWSVIFEGRFTSLMCVIEVVTQKKVSDVDLNTPAHPSTPLSSKFLSLRYTHRFESFCSTSTTAARKETLVHPLR